MPDRLVLVYSLADLGITAGNYNFSTLATGSTFTASATAAPSEATISDTDTEDNIFNDGVPGNFSGAPVNQLLSGTIDGTVFTNEPSNPENEFQVTDSDGTVVGFIYDLHDANSAAFSSLQGYVTTFDIIPGETYTVVRTSNLVQAEYNTFLTCFAQGTLIQTGKGPVAVEDLEVSDLVETRDDGVQPIRWMGHSTVVGKGKFAPIRVKKGALGNTRDLLVSPLHRILICGGWRAELFFGEPELLACAKHLVNGDTIFVDPCEQITYFHLMFDRHQIITAENCPSESYFPGPTTLDSVDEAIREELFSLFPELESGGQDYGPTARICIRGTESASLQLMI
ncbi:MAG: Hint domain-containing protein [Paracoccaceae bacterium]